MPSPPAIAHTGTGTPWLVRHAPLLKTILRVVLGVIWGIDGALKFQPGFVDNFASSITDLGSGQPGWLQPWFNFWAGAVGANPAAVVYVTGSLELLLAIALVAGFARKVAYLGGFFLSLFIWAIPEGFGGPYGPGSTDIGTGIVYALMFVAMMVFNASHGPSRFSLDRAIEARWPSWAKIAEFRPLSPSA